MANEYEIRIPTSKTKLILMLIGSLIFVALGFAFVKDPQAYLSLIGRSKELIFIAGIASVLFFGLASFYLFRKLFDKQPGLIISNIGIFDNSSATPVGHIEWNDIDKTEIITIHRQRIILVKVKSPEKYIRRQESKRIKNVLKANLNYYGTPITITANGLKIRFETLERLLLESLEKSRQ